METHNSALSIITEIFKLQHRNRSVLDSSKALKADLEGPSSACGGLLSKILLIGSRRDNRGLAMMARDKSHPIGLGNSKLCD